MQRLGLFQAAGQPRKNGPWSSDIPRVVAGQFSLDGTGLSAFGPQRRACHGLAAELYFTGNPGTRDGDASIYCDRSPRINGRANGGDLRDARLQNRFRGRVARFLGIPSAADRVWGAGEMVRGPPSLLYPFAPVIGEHQGGTR